MNRFELSLSLIGLVLAGIGAVGCQPGGVGDPCIPEDEYYPTFSGYGVEEVNIESKSFQCETRLCLVNHFQGRVSCPYGQPQGGGTNPCHIPDGSGEGLAAEVAVEPQILERRASETVYCSCRCAGPDKDSKYCECPSGYRCTELNDVPLGADQLKGSYCVKNGTLFEGGNLIDRTTCAAGNAATQCPSEGASSPDANP